MKYGIAYKILLILAVITASMPLALATGESVSVGTFTVAPGSNVTVPVVVGNANLVAGGMVKLTFNPAIVNAVDVSSGTISGSRVSNMNNTAGFVSVAISGTTAVGTTSATLANIIFKGVSSGTSSLTFQPYPVSYLSTATGTLITPTVSNGSITVTGGRPEIVGVYDNIGTWALWNSTTSAADIVGFGFANTTPVVGDWNGDGKTDVGVYNKGGNNFLLKNGTSIDVIGLGWSGVTPVVGTSHRDGKDKVGVYDNAGTWALWNRTTGAADIIGFGFTNTIPVVGDWNGEGRTDVGIYNIGGNNFLLKNGTSIDVIGLGWTGVTPVVGDWNGDGKTDIGVYNNIGTWALWNTTTSAADIVGFGFANTIPVVGDWNSDGKTDVGVYNKGGNNFLLKNGTSLDVIGLGWTGVTPVVGSWS